MSSCSSAQLSPILGAKSAATPVSRPPTPYSAQLLAARSQFCEQDQIFLNLLICSPVHLLNFHLFSARLRRAGWLSYSVSEPLKAGSLTSKYQRVASRKYSLFPPLCRGVVLPALSLSRASPEQCRRVTPRGRVEGCRCGKTNLRPSA